MIVIPGTSKVSHLEENVAAAAIHLSDAESTELDGRWEGRRGAALLLVWPPISDL